VLALRSDLVADRSTALHAGALTRHGRSARLAPSAGRCNHSGSSRCRVVADGWQAPRIARHVPRYMPLMKRQ